jgi:conserved oligomeric Golgi complex subunit 2
MTITSQTSAAVRPQKQAFALPSSSSSSDGNVSRSRRSSGASSSDDDAHPLPFPAALPRTDFLAPSFDAADYLSSLSHRHQTLEDLRSDLRDRSSAISHELLELVNSNYSAFLSLGDELQGGEERVEDVRVALLGFRRAVEEIKERVRDRGDEVVKLNGELGGVRREVEKGRKMIELDERVGMLERRLAVGGKGPGAGEEDDEEDEDEYDDEDEDDEDDEDSGDLSGRRRDDVLGSGLGKLSQLANDYVEIEELVETIGKETLFVRKTEERIIRCRNTLVLDLNTALKAAKTAGVRGQTRLLKLMSLYSLMDAQAEAVKTLKNT